jgi:hypothetical protein
MSIVAEYMINQLKTITQLNISGRLDQLMGMSGELTNEEWSMLFNMLQDEISMIEEPSIALSYIPHIAGLAYAISYHHLPRYIECRSNIYRLLQSHETTSNNEVTSEITSLNEVEMNTNMSQDDLSQDDLSQDDMYKQGELIVKTISYHIHRDDPYFGLVQAFTTIALNELEDDTVEDNEDNEDTENDNTVDS